MLEGVDRDWSAWSTESHRDFTNLGFGRYRFRVRGRNVAGQISGEASYAFTILPPWHRTWWAYAAYLLLLALGAFAVDRLQRWRLLGNPSERRSDRRSCTSTGRSISSTASRKSSPRCSISIAWPG